MRSCKNDFYKVCADNWVIPKMAEGMEGNTARELIDNWPIATRSELLSKMNICEDEDYKRVYQECPPKSKAGAQ